MTAIKLSRGRAGGLVYSDFMQIKNFLESIDPEALTSIDGDPLEITDELRVSAGTVEKPTIVYNPGGTITLGDGVYRFFENEDYSGAIQEFPISGTTLTIPDDETTYVIAHYVDDDTQQLLVTSDISSVNDAVNCVIYTVYRHGDSVSVIDWDEPGLGLTNKMHHRLIETDRFSRVYGFDISEYGTRNLLVSGGKVWQGVKQNFLAETNSVDNMFTLWVNNGDGTFSQTQMTQYPNTEFDPKTGTLSTLATDEYGVLWLYRCMSIDCTVIYGILGNQGYDLNGAKAAQPVEVPQLFNTNTVLIGKVIFQEGAATATEIDSAFEAQFSASITTAHDGLTGLTGGFDGKHDHLPLYNIDGVTPIIGVDRINNMVGIGTDTPDCQLTVKGSTNDGSTNALVLRDSDEANVFEVDTDGSMKIAPNFAMNDGTADRLNIEAANSYLKSPDGNTYFRVYNGNAQIKIDGYSLAPIYANADGATIRSANGSTLVRPKDDGIQIQGAVKAEDEVLARLLGSQFWNVSTGVFETAVQNREYYSPNQHGGIYGTVYRKYHGTAANGGYMSTPGITKLVDYGGTFNGSNVYHGFAGDGASSIYLYSGTDRVTFSIVGWTVQSGWLDYTK